MKYILSDQIYPFNLKFMISLALPFNALLSLYYSIQNQQMLKYQILLLGMGKRKLLPTKKLTHFKASLLFLHTILGFCVG